MQRTAFLLGAATASAAAAGAAVGKRGAVGACRRRYCSLSRTVPFHWQTFLPELLAPDGVLSALRLRLGFELADSGCVCDSVRAGTLGARSTKRTVLIVPMPVPVLVAMLQKLRTGTGEAVTTCCCTGKAVRFSVCSASSTWSS